MNATQNNDVFYAEAARDVKFWSNRLERCRAVARHYRRKGRRESDRRLSRVVARQYFAADALELAMIEAGWA